LTQDRLTATAAVTLVLGKLSARQVFSRGQRAPKLPYPIQGPIEVAQDAVKRLFDFVRRGHGIAASSI
jgi:hypothetical protein